MGISLLIPMGYGNYGFMQSKEAAAFNKTADGNNNHVQAAATTNLPQQEVYQASVQASLNYSLYQTIKYLKLHESKTKKKPIFGELFSSLETKDTKNESEIIEFEINCNAKNIFAA